MQIQVRINEDGALRNQRYAFTDRFTLVTELLQNARRAGATHIVVDHDDEKRQLTVRDDGLGIPDFQSLLSFHESGWDADTVAQEHPFGVGFSKCLYAAARVVVSSGRHRVDIDTAAALRREPVDVETMDAQVPGTLVELYGVDVQGIAVRIATICQGFSVDVIFNGQHIARPYAPDRLTLRATSIGAVHLAGDDDGDDTQQTLMFLQGFCVKTPLYPAPDRVNVVHLDPSQFMARGPDRDKLIDEDQQLRRVNAELTRQWREILMAAKARLEPVHFVETYYEAMRHWGHLNLLDDVDEVPARLFDRIVGYPIQGDASDEHYLESPAAAPSRSAIERGEVTLVSLESLTEENAAHWMLARAKGWWLFHVHGLGAAHWIRPFVHHLDDSSAEVMPLDVQAHTAFAGRWVWPEIVLCRAVRIRVEQHEAEVIDGAVCHEGTVLVPAGECTGDAVLQLSTYIDDNDRYDGEDEQADRDALADLIRRLRATDPASLFQSLLRELSLERYPLLQGKRFEVGFATGGVPSPMVAVLGHASEQPSRQPDGGRHA